MNGSSPCPTMTMEGWRKGRGTNAVFLNGELPAEAGSRLRCNRRRDRIPAHACHGDGERDWACAHVVEVCLCGCCPGRLVWFVFDGGFAAEAGVDAAAVVEVFDPGGDLGVDLVAGGGTPVVVLGCWGGLQGLGHGVIPAHLGLPHRCGSLRGAHVGG